MSTGITIKATRPDGVTMYWEIGMSAINDDLLPTVAGRVAYDSETGILLWLPRSDEDAQAPWWNAKFAWKQCGKICKSGYRRICFRINGKDNFISAHRLAWFIYYGRPPIGYIDHINQDKTDNRISNMREVTASINSRNMSMLSTNSSGVTGVCWNKARKAWRARAMTNGTRAFLGYFDDIETAKKAIEDFRSMHGYTANHGRSRDKKPA